MPEAKFKCRWAGWQFWRRIIPRTIILTKDWLPGFEYKSVGFLFWRWTRVKVGLPLGASSTSTPSAPADAPHGGSDAGGGS